MKLGTLLPLAGASFVAHALRTSEHTIYKELFNLNDYPGEKRNVAGIPEYASVLKQHRTRCREMVAELVRQLS